MPDEAVEAGRNAVPLQVVPRPPERLSNGGWRWFELGVSGHWRSVTADHPPPPDAFGYAPSASDERKAAKAARRQVKEDERARVAAERQRDKEWRAAEKERLMKEKKERKALEQARMQQEIYGLMKPPATVCCPFRAQLPLADDLTDSLCVRYQQQPSLPRRK